MQHASGVMAIQLMEVQRASSLQSVDRGTLDRLVVGNSAIQRAFADSGLNRERNPERIERDAALDGCCAPTCGRAVGSRANRAGLQTAGHGGRTLPLPKNGELNVRPLP